MRDAPTYDNRRGGLMGAMIGLMLAEGEVVLEMLHAGGVRELGLPSRTRRISLGELTSATKREIIISVAATAGALAYRRGDDDERECRGIRAYRPVYEILDRIRDIVVDALREHPTEIYDLISRGARTRTIDAAAVLTLSLIAPDDGVDLTPTRIAAPPSRARFKLMTGTTEAQEWALKAIDRD